MKRVLVQVGIAVGIVGLMLVSLVLGGYVRAATTSSERYPAPAGMNKYLVFMAHSALHLDEIFIYGDSFQREIMKRTPAEIVATEATAEQFFWEQFGLNFTQAKIEDGAQVIDGARLISFMLNPDLNYRAHTISGENVPSEGWVVRDGGYIVMLTKDTVLHGKYGGADGILAHAGDFILWGEYNIAVPNRTPIVIQYQSPMPMAMDPHMGMMIDCMINSTEWGDGRAIGFAAMMPEPDGRLRIMTRNVLTFPKQ